ncbi:MAG: ParB/RepB/Spo0J family partition protein [Chloroflexi bacterium]|uniref:ParB/RepB/Spo0J family partition protein n=1 Tax=Candidatus Chlorohelix allophototropha TaxID=3003348 RepID=A0A8T7M3X9_9CHLR|nr:ParB/RepB/Spo0J family partition protein [Chloroflexota bacterium]WJW70228.1 ParB/RepB/Spo0J family partition protein [Chloroflexota bacterium L227-S17]
MSKKNTTGTDFFANLRARAGDIQKLTDNSELKETEELEILRLELILPNPDQPRKIPAPVEDEQLVADVKERGILQPIIVRPSPEQPGKYLLVAGNRRVGAAGQAGLSHIPAIVRDYTEKEARTVAAIENLQRQDLDPLDEARYFRFLGVEYNLSNRDIAKLVNKSPSYVDQRMRMLEKRVKNTHLLQKAQTNITEKTIWKYRPRDWQKFHQTLEALGKGYSVAPIEEKKKLRQEIQLLREHLAALEKDMKD